MTSATVAFFLKVNRFCEVLATRTLILKNFLVDRELATTIWCSPEYGSVDNSCGYCEGAQVDVCLTCDTLVWHYRILDDYLVVS